MAFTEEEIKIINSKGNAIPFRRYVTISGTVYKGTTDGRLILEDKNLSENIRSVNSIDKRVKVVETISAKNSTETERLEKDKADKCYATAISIAL